MDNMQTEEQCGRRQTTATKNKIAKAMKGDKNPAYKNGGRSYREKVGAKKGQLVHHRDGNRKNNKSSNLRIIKKSDRGKHDKLHHRADNFSRGKGKK